MRRFALRPIQTVPGGFRQAIVLPPAVPAVVDDGPCSGVSPPPASVSVFPDPELAGCWLLNSSSVPSGYASMALQICSGDAPATWPLLRDCDGAQFNVPAVP